MKQILNVVIAFAVAISLNSCTKDEQGANGNGSGNSIVGTWVRYEHYEVSIDSDGTVCENSGNPTSGDFQITFNADGTMWSTAYDLETWTYDATSGEITEGNPPSGPNSKVIYYNEPQIPWSWLTTPSGAQDPTIYISYDLSLGAGGGCQTYLYTQYRMRKQ